MLNLQDFIGHQELFKKMKVDDLLFVEYKCPIEESTVNVWWHNNFFAYVLAGELILKTPENKYVLTSGDCYFAKKGSVIAHNRTQDDFCEVLVFLPDSFIKTVVEKYKLRLGTASPGKKSDTIIPLIADDVLTTYFHSLLTYFPLHAPPPEALLRLKFEELIVNILSNDNYKSLKVHFGDICSSAKPSIKAIMEANFFSNLSLDEFARMCARSLSAFKSEFNAHYNTTPGKWLQEKRLEYSHFLLETTNYSLDEICDASGFENISHFIRVFKRKYGFSPGKFKNRNQQSALDLNALSASSPYPKWR